MKQKAITLILSIIAILVPLLIIPSSDDSNYNILKLIVLLIGGLALLILLLVNYKTLTIDKKDIIILIFLVLIFLSTFYSSDIKKSILGEKNRYEGLLMFCTYICIYFSAKKYFKYKKISKFLNTFFYVSMIIGILGIAQKYISYKPLYPIFDKGMCSTLGNSNFFGSFISIVFPISTVIFIIKSDKKSFALSLVMFFNMIASGTRSAWVALVFAGLFGLIYLIKQKNKMYFKRTIILMSCFIIICIYLFGGFGFMPRTVMNSNIFLVNDPATKIGQIKSDLKLLQEKGFSKEMGSSRIQIWDMTFELITEKPILGCGPDNLMNGLVSNCIEKITDFVYSNGCGVDKAHNEYLHIAATLGVPALVCYLLFVSSILLPKIKVSFHNNTYFIISLTIISYLTQAFFNISTIGVAPLFWMILGMSDNKDLIKQLNDEIYRGA